MTERLCGVIGVLEAWADEQLQFENESNNFLKTQSKKGDNKRSSINPENVDPTSTAPIITKGVTFGAVSVTEFISANDDKKDKENDDNDNDNDNESEDGSYDSNDDEMDEEFENTVGTLVKYTSVRNLVLLKFFFF